MARKTNSKQPGTDSNAMTLRQGIGKPSDGPALESHQKERMPETMALEIPTGHAGFEAYLRKVRAARPLERSEEVALFERWQNHGDLSARKTLLLSNLR